jgi:hypothetical protein
MHDRDLMPSRNPEAFKSAVKLWETCTFWMGLRIADRRITSLGVSHKIHGHSKHSGRNGLSLDLLKAGELFGQSRIEKSIRGSIRITAKLVHLWCDLKRN